MLIKSDAELAGVWRDAARTWLTLLQRRRKQKRQRREAERTALPSCELLEVDVN